MKAPENMDSTDLCPAGPSDDDIRRSVQKWLDEYANDFDPDAFFESYIDPEGPFRWTGDFDARYAINVLLRDDPHLIAEALREYIKECR